MNTINTDTGPMSRDEYIDRAQRTYALEGGLGPEQAHAQAVIQAEQTKEGFWIGESPEDAAREEMSCWTDDEAAA